MLAFRKSRSFVASLLCVIACVSSANGVCVYGFVSDRNGNPVASADLDFIDVLTGIKLLTGGLDNTDPLGAYNVCIPPGTYDISWDPPDSTHLLGAWVYNIDLTSYLPFDKVPVPDTDVVLELGWKVSGTVTDSLGNPVALANINVDSIDGGRTYTPNDKTKLISGAYWIVVPPEPHQYRIRIKSPPNSRLRGLQLDTVLIAGDTTIDAVLSTGVLLSGYVRDTAGQGLLDVSIDLRDAGTGKKIYIDTKYTDAAGHYVSAVPTGVFQLRVLPPPDSHLMGVMVDSFAIGGDVTFDTTLRPGTQVTCVVHDTAGLPVQRVNLNFNLESTGLKVYTPYDKTDSAGTATVVVSPDTYRIKLVPPPGTTFDQLVVPGVTIQKDTTIYFTIVELPRINLAGQVTDEQGSGLADAKIDVRIPLNGNRVYVANNKTDSVGAFDVAVPVGTFNMLVWPPPGTRYVGARINDVTFNVDTVWSPIVLGTGVLITTGVTDELGVPVAEVNLDFISETTGQVIFTPGDNTDTSGTSQVVVPVDIYTLVLTPLDGSPYLPKTVTGLNLTYDTTLNFKLGAKSVRNTEASFILRQSYPNPFNDATIIEYVILAESEVSLKVYNILGQLVKNLAHEYPTASTGLHITTWNGTNNNGQSVASGIYFYRLMTDKESDTRRMLLIR